MLFLDVFSDADGAGVDPNKPIPENAMGGQLYDEYMAGEMADEAETEQEARREALRRAKHQLLLAQSAVQRWLSHLL